MSLPRGKLTMRGEKTKSGTARHLPISPRLRGVLDMVRYDVAGEPHMPQAYVFWQRHWAEGRVT